MFSADTEKVDIVLRAVKEYSDLNKIRKVLQAENI